MNAFKNTLCEMLVLVAISAVIGLAGNAVRAKGSIEIAKVYFKHLDPVDHQPETASAQPVSDSPATAPDTASDQPIEQATTPRTDTATTEDAQAELIHGFQLIKFERVAEVFRDPNTKLGINIFVDARNDASFEDGHVPGAFQLDHYELDLYIDNVLPYAEGAEIVVVYCNGGDCEDSGFVCNDLSEAGVSWDNLFLFQGGWTEWTDKKMPVATGKEEDGEEP